MSKYLKDAIRIVMENDPFLPKRSPKGAVMSSKTPGFRTQQIVQEIKDELELDWEHAQDVEDAQQWLDNALADPLENVEELLHQLENEVGEGKAEEIINSEIRPYLLQVVGFRDDESDLSL